MKANDEFSETHSPKIGKKVVEEEFTYRTFQGCKPADLTGNEGAVAAIRWIENGIHY